MTRHTIKLALAQTCNFKITDIMKYNKLISTEDSLPILVLATFQTTLNPLSNTVTGTATILNITHKTIKVSIIIIIIN